VQRYGYAVTDRSTGAGERWEEVEPFPPSLQGLWGLRIYQMRIRTAN
jgi:hypothetical protein